MKTIKMHRKKPGYTTEERFWCKVDKSGGEESCWPWLGAVNPAGYGVFEFDRKTLRSPRVAMALSEGGIEKLPEYAGVFILHKCDNPTCCNPRHLFKGSARDNSLDMVSKGRAKLIANNPGSQARGSGHGRAKLNESDVHKIRAMRLNGESVSKIAKRFKVAHGTIDFILRGETWIHV